MAKKKKKVIDIEYDEKENVSEVVEEEEVSDTILEEEEEINSDNIVSSEKIEDVGETDEVEDDDELEEVNDEEELTDDESSDDLETMDESSEDEEVIEEDEEEISDSEDDSLDSEIDDNELEEDECSCEECSCHKKKSVFSDLLLVLIVAVILVGSFFMFGGIPKKIELPVTIKIGDTAGLHEVDYDKYFSLVDSGEPFILIVERDGCSYCEKYMPVVQQVVDERQIPIYYVNMANWETEKLNEFLSSNSYVRGNNWGTPSTLLLVGNRVAATITQYVEKEELLEFLDKNIIFE